MRVAFLDNTEIVLNIAFFNNDFSGSFDNFYPSDAVSHKVLGEAEIAIVGENGTSFIEKPFSTWIWNEDLVTYESPVPMPSYNPETHHCKYDDPTSNWIVLEH
jgi:hypothetical protein